jgi:hypothetical protein
MTIAGLAGRRILLVEDELLIAMLLEASLEDHGSQNEQLDGALMDVNLAGERIFPAAEILAARAVPFLLLSGYGDKALPDGRAHWPVQSKPFEIGRVLEALSDMIGRVRMVAPAVEVLAGRKNTEAPVTKM